MALRQLASQAASGLGLRCTAPSLALTQSPVGLLQAALFRSYSTGEAMRESFSEVVVG